MKSTSKYKLPKEIWKHWTKAERQLFVEENIKEICGYVPNDKELAEISLTFAYYEFGSLIEKNNFAGQNIIEQLKINF